jgi:hypothetical protein
VSSTDVLLNVATAARLFHTSEGTTFADLIMDNHRETWPLRSKRFQVWLRQQYYERTWDAPSPAALNAALNMRQPKHVGPDILDDVQGAAVLGRKRAGQAAKIPARPELLPNAAIAASRVGS